MNIRSECVTLMDKRTNIQCMHVVEISVIPHVTPGFCHY
jgi:hypothetical protein